jgi:NlpC/P60 family putative phage cell wall peptidase
LDAAETYLVALDLVNAQPGDVLLFRFSKSSLVKHCAVISAPDRMTHAWQGHSVCETAISPFWRRRIAAAFQFPIHPT